MCLKCGYVKSWSPRNSIWGRITYCLSDKRKFASVCAGLAINDFPVVLVTARRKAALRGDTWQFRNDNHFRPATPVQTEAAYSPRRSLRFPRARAAVCWNNTSDDYLRGQRAESDASRG